jgi:DNA helicase-2/ATP-dependent DNA helicase PcrA
MQKLKDEFNIELNEQQRKAVLHKDGPAIVLAVPGAGKTTVLICRTANLILNHNIPCENILSVTFSRASALDMNNRFTSLFGKISGRKVYFSTIHSFSYRLIREYALRKGLKYTLIEDGNSSFKNKILKEIYMKLNRKHINDDKLEDLLNTICYVKNMMINPEEFDTYSSFNIDNFKEIYTYYERYKRKNNLIDFDDMLTLTYEILSNDSILLKKYQMRYKYIQVDEGQDVSKIQNSIISLLASPKNNLFIVADDDQSIYGFRGAYPQALLNFTKIYNGARKFFMEENFRSSSNIVFTSNQLIKNNNNRYDKNIYTKNPDGKPVTIVKIKDEYDQLKYLVKELSGVVNPTSTAILYRNNISAVPLVDKLTRHNIPFYIKDSKITFFKHWAVKDIICFLRLIIDNSDIESFEHIYYKMKGYISKALVQFVKENNKSESVFDTLLKYPDFKSFQYDNIYRLKSDFKRLLKRKPVSILNSIEADLEYNDYVKDYCKKFGYSYTNVKTVISTLKIIASETNSIIEFLDRLEKLQHFMEDNKRNKTNGVLLSTIHSSKGLEFENVYMIDLVDGDIPSSSSIDLHDNGNKEALGEERRLFYVGMTRAKSNLKLITINTRDGEYMAQSRFIDELENIIKEPNPVGSSFNKGDLVIHKKFGSGKVKSIDGNIITIDFGEKGIKHLSLDFSIKNGIIIPVDN